MATTAIIFVSIGIIVTVGASPIAQHGARHTRQANSVCTTIGEDINGGTLVNSTVAILQPRHTCNEWKQDFSDSGYYFLSPTGGCEIKVFCDMCINDSNGWIIIQRRRNGSVSFEDKFWHDYRDGFGHYTGNYWMGLEKMHLITSSADYDLHIAVQRNTGAIRTAYYTKFRIGNHSERYKIMFDETDGPLRQQRGKKFSTRDQDNDIYNNHTCSPNSGILYGGWWFGDNDQTATSSEPNCYPANLNGQYDATGVNRIQWESLTIVKTIMAIRRSST